jgi:hypothetical protein
MLKPNLKIKKWSRIFLVCSGAGWKLYMVYLTLSSLICQVIDDPSGNSFVENPHAPQKDNALVITYYDRTPQQAEMLGLQVSGLIKSEGCSGAALCSGS